MKLALILAAALLLSACSTFKMGMVCYVPYGQVGSCEVAPPAPAASAAK